MYSGLMFDEIIMDYIKRNLSSHHTAENECVFTQIFLTSYINTGDHFKISIGRKKLMSVYKCHVNISVKKGTKLNIIGTV